jgi:hypothetical protein
MDVRGGHPSEPLNIANGVVSHSKETTMTRAKFEVCVRYFSRGHGQADGLRIFSRDMYRNTWSLVSKT